MTAGILGGHAPEVVVIVGFVVIGLLIWALVRAIRPASRSSRGGRSDRR